MAGETPHAARVNRLEHLNTADPNAAYRMKGVTNVIQNMSRADTASGAPAPAIPRRNPSHTELIQSADDKYYRDRNPVVVPTASPTRAARPLVQRRPGALPGPHKPMASQPAGTPGGLETEGNRVRITSIDAVRPGIDAVVQMLQSGLPLVIVEVADEPKDLLRRTRAQFESMVTRESITEDQSRDVRFARIPVSSTALPPVQALIDQIAAGPPEPAGEVKVDDGTFTGDIAGFINGDGESADENFLDPAVTEPFEVKEVPEITDDENFDFLAGAAPTQTDPPVTETQETQPERRPRRRR